MPAGRAGASRRGPADRARDSVRPSRRGAQPLPGSRFRLGKGRQRRRPEVPRRGLCPDAQGPAPARFPLVQEKNDLRLLIAQRVQQIYASRPVIAGDNHKTIPLDENKDVLDEIASFQTREKKHFLEAYQRSGHYREIILDELRREGLPEELSWLPMIESWFKVKALSPARALGTLAVHLLDRLPVRPRAGTGTWMSGWTPSNPAGPPSGTWESSTRSSATGRPPWPPITAARPGCRTSSAPSASITWTTSGTSTASSRSRRPGSCPVSSPPC